MRPNSTSKWITRHLQTLMRARRISNNKLLSREQGTKNPSPNLPEVTIATIRKQNFHSKTERYDITNRVPKWSLWDSKRAPSTRNHARRRSLGRLTTLLSQGTTPSVSKSRNWLPVMIRSRTAQSYYRCSHQAAPVCWKRTRESNFRCDYPGRYFALPLVYVHYNVAKLTNLHFCISLVLRNGETRADRSVELMLLFLYVKVVSGEWGRVWEMRDFSVSWTLFKKFLMRTSRTFFITVRDFSNRILRLTRIYLICSKSRSAWAWQNTLFWCSYCCVRVNFSAVLSTAARR